jgi:hypothetical protein
MFDCGDEGVIVVGRSPRLNSAVLVRHSPRNQLQLLATGGNMKGFNRSVLAVVALAISDIAVVVQGEDYTYTTDNGAITITKYIGPGGDVTIPSTINEVPVTTIGYGAFWSCTNVTRIAIPESVTTISDGVFTGCDRLAAIAVDPANPAYSSLDGVLFNKASTTLTRCPQAKAGHYTVPSGVARIGPAAFASCASLTTVDLPDTVTTIAADAFYWCTSLTGMVIPGGVNNIASWTFAYNSSLTNLTILGSITNVGNWAFYSTDLLSLDLPDSVVSIEHHAFYFCGLLTEAIVGSGVTSIGDSAFAAAGNLTAVYFRGNAPSLGLDVFAGDNRATVYYLPGTSGWDVTFGGRPTALWRPQIQSGGPDFGVHAGQMGFNVLWTRGMTVVVEASTTLFPPVWSSLSTNILTSDSLHFSDSEWANHPSRFYRIRSP